MISPPDSRSQTKYCDFHWDNGHGIEQCIKLRKELEQAIRQGYLKEFIACCAYQQMLTPRTYRCQRILGGQAIGAKGN